METYLSTRPTSFTSLAAGIEWHTRSRTIRNQTSARVSVPSLLVDSHDNTSSDTVTNNPREWTWRTDLSATKPFWENWFVGLSQKFLEARGGKLLLLAGTDRLDKELTIGQMQGKPHLEMDQVSFSLLLLLLLLHLRLLRLLTQDYLQQSCSVDLAYQLTRN